MVEVVAPRLSDADVVIHRSLANPRGPPVSSTTPVVGGTAGKCQSLSSREGFQLVNRAEGSGLWLECGRGEEDIHASMRCGFVDSLEGFHEWFLSPPEREVPESFRQGRREGRDANLAKEIIGQGLSLPEGG